LFSKSIQTLIATSLKSSLKCIFHYFFSNKLNRGWESEPFIASITLYQKLNWNQRVRITILVSFFTLRKKYRQIQTLKKRSMNGSVDPGGIHQIKFCDCLCWMKLLEFMQSIFLRVWKKFPHCIFSNYHNPGSNYKALKL